MKKKAGNNNFLKKYNRAHILDLIRLNGQQSRIELSKSTGLSPTAAGVIANELINEGYLQETGTGDSKGGRKPVMLELKDRSFFSAGIDIDVGIVKLVIIDLKSNIVFRENYSLDTRSFKDTMFFINRQLEALLSLLGITGKRLVGLGISVPGLVDIKNHEIILAPNLGWKEKNIERELNYIEENNAALYIENEAMASAIYESWAGISRGLENFVCINIKSGIGAGFFTNGMLYRGKGGTAGEVGHIQVDEQGPQCGCGNRGCLETLASTRAIEEIAGESIEKTILKALKGEDDSRKVLLDAAYYLGIGISFLVNTLNPEMIVMGKDFTRYSSLVIGSLKAVVEEKALKAPFKQVQIMASLEGEDSSALGAAIMPLKVLFGR